MQQNWPYRATVLFSVALLLLWSLMPIYWTLATSITPTTDFGARPIHFYPTAPTFDHYLRLFGITATTIGGVNTAAQFKLALLNSIITSGAATALCVLFSLMGAYAFTRLEFPFRQTLFYAVVATLAIPGYAVLIPLFRIMVSFHQIDAYLGVTLIYVSAYLPLCLWLLRGVLDILPRSLEEAARMDGASHFRILFEIITPLAAPGLTAAAILTFLGAWDNILCLWCFRPKSPNR